VSCEDVSPSDNRNVANFANLVITVFVNNMLLAPITPAPPFAVVLQSPVQEEAVLWPAIALPEKTRLPIAIPMAKIAAINGTLKVLNGNL
jgi:hypothetical protein